MTSWTMCWSGSRHLDLVCHDLASPSICPPSSSTASSLSTIASVLFSWVRNDYQTGGKRYWVHWFLTLTLGPSRGTSHHCGPAGETEDIPENWYGGPQQVRAGAQQFTHLPLFRNTKLSLVLVAIFQTISGLPGCSVSPGGDRRSSGPFIRSDAHAACYTQSQYTDTGTKYQNKERKLTLSIHF